MKKLIKEKLREEFLSENENIDKELDKVIDAIQDLKAKIKSQGMVTNARDEDHLKRLQDHAKELKKSLK